MISTPVRPNVVILEPSITHLRGHHLNGIVELVRAMAPIRPTIVVNVRTDRRMLPADLTVHGLFEHTAYQQPALSPQGDGFRRVQRELARFRRKAHSTIADLAERASSGVPENLLGARRAARRWSARLAPRQWPELPSIADRTNLFAADHIIVPTAEPALVLELQEMFLARSADAGPRVHARILEIGRRAWRARLDRLFARLADFPELAERLHLYVEMPAMQRAFMELYGWRPEIFPHLLNAPPGSTPRRATSWPVAFGCLGAARKEKGFDRLPNILRAAAKHAAFDRRRISFVVQTGRSGQEVEALIATFKDAASELGVRVEVHENSLSPARYAALLDRIDCLLMPYAADRYRLSGSGILFEALLHGKPFICSAGMSFSDFAREGNGIEAADDASFAEAIVRIANNSRPYVDAAWAYAQSYRAMLEQTPIVARIRNGRSAADWAKSRDSTISRTG